jgi:hypothetical protein
MRQSLRFSVPLQLTVIMLCVLAAFYTGFENLSISPFLQRSHKSAESKQNILVFDLICVSFESSAVHLSWYFNTCLFELVSQLVWLQWHDTS